jgi:hypothetical protein
MAAASVCHAEHIIADALALNHAKAAGTPCEIEKGYTRQRSPSWPGGPGAATAVVNLRRDIT